MDSEIVGSVTEWGTVPVGRGYDGLHDLADAAFSGGVTAGDAWGFMLNGRLVGIQDGSLASFEGAELTAYEAPSPALPLLYTMQSQDTEKQAEYYTNETAIAEADTTLADGNFTGYIELSENVLSGDYYVVYHGGRSMSVAFVGNSRRLLTDEEAFERANDEVGIYKVYPADIDVIDLPERESSSSTAADPTPDPAGDADSESMTSSESTEPDDGATAEGISSGSIDIPQAGGTDTDTEPATDEQPEPPTADDSPSTEPSTTVDTQPDDSGEPTEPTDNRAEQTEPTETTTPAAETGHDDTAVDTDLATGSTDTPATGGPTADTNSPTDAGASGTAQANTEPFQEEAEWRNTTTIPSLDPSDDDRADAGTQGGGGQQTVTRSDERLSRQQLRERLDKAETVMEKAEQRHKELATERDEAREKRDAAQQRIEELEAELTAAKERIEELEAELAATGTAATSTQAADTPPQSTRSMTPADALVGTNLFVRYDSKGAATLADAHDGEATPEDIEGNIRIDTHTTFDTEGLEVDGTPFEAFLDGRIEVAFAEWLVSDLLFELRSTGATTALKPVYDAIPQIDRIELRGTIELGTDEDEEPIERTFDVVVRDKRGKPLFIADFDASKQPVGADLIEGLIRNGNALRERNESFAAGFGVTSSYFTEDAYEMADDATGGGLFSRSSGKSFVNISRKQGFHLCLVDRIKGGFELQKPEL